MASWRRDLKGYLDLCRVSNLPTVWTNVLAAMVLSGAGFSWNSFLILLLSMSLFYSGGMCLNDLIDLAVDTKKRPSRPIPSGRVSKGRAWIFAVVLFIAALWVACSVPHRVPALISACLLLILIVVYDLLHKAHAWTVVLMAGCRLMIFVVVAAALTGSIVSGSLLAGSIQFLYVIIISIVARYENRLARPFSFPLIPVMLAGISLLDGMVMAALLSAPSWLLAGVAGTILTRFGQRYVRGD
jgi:4-hydroxybenzoate polyprenyltransferase